MSLNSLNELSREQIFEGIVLLLWNCDPKTRLLWLIILPKIPILEPLLIRVCIFYEVGFTLSSR